MGRTSPDLPHPKGLAQTRRAPGSAAVLFLATGLALATSRAAQTETVTYTLTPQPQTGRIDVELVWETAGRTGSRMCVAEHWGSVANVPALLKNVKVDGATQVRAAGACWDMQHRTGAVIRCSYTVDPGRRELDWAKLHSGFFSLKSLLWS